MISYKKKGWIKLKTYITMVIVILSFMLVIAGCGVSGSSSSTQPGEDDNIQPVQEGFILEVSEAQILIVERVKAEDFDKTWNEIMDQDPGNAIWLSTSNAGDFQVGQKVRYWVKGAVMESYPTQGTAHKIEVIAERPEEGFIFEIKESQVLILDNVKAEDFDKSWNDIFERYEGNAIWLQTEEALSFQIGQKVQYWIDGGIAKSYPAQGTAHKIEVIAERPLENAAFRNLTATGSQGHYVVTGEARVFEAVMSYAVSDGHNYLVEDFHTLDAGAPEWSAFTLDIHISEEQLPVNGTLMIEVFEHSAKDGSVVNLLNLALESFE